jgi:hypothetical protein
VYDKTTDIVDTIKYSDTWNNVREKSSNFMGNVGDKA